MIADITSKMIDQGTKHRSKLEIAIELEDVGASISFLVDEFWCRFSIRCLKEDVHLVISLLAEQLREPLFDPKELEVVKQRTIGVLEKQKESTTTVGHIKFRQAIYPVDHPLYQHDLNKQIEKIRAIQRKDLVQFHDSVYGLGNFIISIVGDIENEEEILQCLKHSFGNWKKVSVKMPPISTKAQVPSKFKAIHTEMKDKSSLILYLGHSIGIDRTHPVSHFEKYFFIKGKISLLSRFFFFFKRIFFHCTLEIIF